MTATESVTRQSPGTGPAKTTRKLGAVLLLIALLALALFASLLLGARSVSIGTVIDALWNFDPSNGDQGVVASRFARPVGAIGVGAARGLAGAGLQGLTRNPLADTGILGLNAGSSMAVVLAIAFLGVSSLGGIMVAAFAGAAGVMAREMAVSQTASAMSPSGSVRNR